MSSVVVFVCVLHNVGLVCPPMSFGSVYSVSEVMLMGLQEYIYLKLFVRILSTHFFYTFVPV